MSSKKDKLYLNLALNLAKNMEGLTGTNPSVGSVLVKNDEIVSLIGIVEIDCIFLYILYGSSIHIYIPTLYNIFPFASCVTPHNLLQLLYSIP